MIRSKSDINVYRTGKRGIYHYRFLVRKTIEGQLKTVEVRRSSGKTSVGTARDQAWQDYLAESGQLPNGEKRSQLRTTQPTIGEIVDKYLTGITSHVSIKPRSARQNTQALLRIVSLVHPKKDPRSLRPGALTGHTVLKWRKARYAERGLSFPEDLDLNLNLSLNSELRCARSVFSKQARRWLYGKMNLPDLDEFMKVAYLDQKATGYQPILPSVIEKMKKDAAKLAELNPPNYRLYVIWELAFYCGLRSNEILELRWSWIEPRNEDFAIGIIDRPANEKLGIPQCRVKTAGWVPVSAERVKRWKKWFPTVGPADYVVPGKHKTDREIAVQREACDWVGQFLEEDPLPRVKRLHELRKHAGSMIYTRDGVAEAALFLRDSVQTTLKHYAHLLNPVRPL